MAIHRSASPRAARLQARRAPPYPVDPPIVCPQGRPSRQARRRSATALPARPPPLVDRRDHRQPLRLPRALVLAGRDLRSRGASGSTARPSATGPRSARTASPSSTARSSGSTGEIVAASLTRRPSTTSSLAAGRRKPATSGPPTSPAAPPSTTGGPAATRAASPSSSVTPATKARARSLASSSATATRSIPLGRRTKPGSPSWVATPMSAGSFSKPPNKPPNLLPGY
jgi:hypothetical protein